MQFGSKRVWALRAVALGLALTAGGWSSARAQEGQDDPDEGSRQIKLNSFMRSRPAAPDKPKPAPSAAPVYRKVTADSAQWNERPAPAASAPKPAPVRATTAAKRRPVRPQPKPAAPPPPGGYAEIGVTVWRLRPAKLSDGPTLSFMTAEGLEELVTPVRIKGTDPVSLGDRLRLSIESPRTGYLYVINRTQFADGSVGCVQLIFPTPRTRGGDNRVTAGRLVDIPDQVDTPNFFTLTDEPCAAGKKSVGEILDIIVSPRPVPELASDGRLPVHLTAAQVEKWAETWGRLEDQLELLGGEGKTWTQAEKDAGAGGRSLTHTEPQPQTVYRVRVNPNGPAMATVQLLYGENKAARPKKVATN